MASSAAHFQDEYDKYRRLLDGFTKANSTRKKSLGGSAYRNSISASLNEAKEALEAAQEQHPPTDGGRKDPEKTQDDMDTDQDPHYEGPQTSPPKAPASSPTPANMNDKDSNQTMNAGKQDTMERFCSGLPYYPISQFENAVKDQRIKLARTSSENIQSIDVSQLKAATINLIQVVDERCKLLKLRLADIEFPEITEANFYTSSIMEIYGWLCTHMGLTDAQPEASLVTSAQSSSGPSGPSVYDREKNKMVRMSASDLKEARDNPESWPASVEAGVMTAKAVLGNHVGSFKCLTHKEIRGKQISARPGYLTCGCPVESGALELWLVKTAAQRAWYETEMRVLKNNMSIIRVPKTSHLHFTPESLLMVEAALEAVSGVRVGGLLTSLPDRLRQTARWVIMQLASVHEEDYESLMDVGAKLDEILVGAQQRKFGSSE